MMVSTLMKRPSVGNSHGRLLVFMSMVSVATAANLQACVPTCA